MTSIMLSIIFLAIIALFFYVFQQSIILFSSHFNNTNIQIRRRQIIIIFRFLPNMNGEFIDIC